MKNAIDFEEDDEENEMPDMDFGSNLIRYKGRKKEIDLKQLRNVVESQEPINIREMQKKHSELYENWINYLLTGFNLLVCLEKALIILSSF
jgi:hypothetical protein